MSGRLRRVAAGLPHSAEYLLCWFALTSGHKSIRMYQHGLLVALLGRESQAFLSRMFLTGRPEIERWERSWQILRNRAVTN
jgi:hypothetical protein